MLGNGHSIFGTPIAVDMWDVRLHPDSRIFFLSHFHSDHMVGLTSSWQYPIYMSELTAKLLMKKIEIKSSLIRILSIGEEHLIYLDNEEKETMSVTLYDANHCPGSVMFLFRGYFGNILYTGDFRSSPEMLSSLLLLPSIDVLYLDNTYCSPKCEFSSREDATEAILHRLHECLLTSRRVFLGLDNVGKEELLQKIHEETHSKVCVGAARAETLELLGYSDIITTDSSKAKVIVVSTNQITGVNIRRWNEEMSTCAILPTARYHGLGIKPYSSYHNIHVIPYSNHSSFGELLGFVKLVKPCQIFPVVSERRKGIFGIDTSDRLNMSVFEKFLSGVPRREFVIPTSVTKFMQLKGFCQERKNRQQQGKWQQKPAETRQKAKSAVAAKGVRFENDSLETVKKSRCATKKEAVKHKHAKLKWEITHICVPEKCPVCKSKSKE